MLVFFLVYLLCGIVAGEFGLKSFYNSPLARTHMSEDIREDWDNRSEIMRSTICIALSLLLLIPVFAFVLLIGVALY